jgi:hypothetical protein
MMPDIDDIHKEDIFDVEAMMSFNDFTGHTYIRYIDGYIGSSSHGLVQNGKAVRRPNFGESQGSISTKDPNHKVWQG